MSESCSDALLEQILRGLARPYRLPQLPGPALSDSRPSTTLAMVIEQARRALEAGTQPAPHLEQEFVSAMGALIDEAMQQGTGDPAFQAMVLKHGSPAVREHALLTTQRQQDQRRMRSLVNTIAHPARLQRMAPSLRRETLAQLRAAVHAAAWPAMDDALERLLAMPDVQADTALIKRLEQLQVEPAQQRLERIEVLQAHVEVRQYLALWEQQGPPANSPAAAVEGAAGRRRGMAVETLTKQALQALAQRLNAQAQGRPYRVVTAMHVPAAFPASREGAKTEWDAVLLRQAPGHPAADVWDIRLLVEAKASADAAGTDLARLLRGLRLLAQADAAQRYHFKSREGMIALRGASLSTLPLEASRLENTVLYCSNDASDKDARLLSAAARMQLLSAPQSLAFASARQQQQQSRTASTRPLKILWQEILSAAPWQAVLHQYPTLRQARELMVHPEDLRRASEP